MNECIIWSEIIIGISCFSEAGKFINDTKYWEGKLFFQIKFFLLTLDCNIFARRYDWNTAGNDQTWLASIDKRLDPEPGNLNLRASGHCCAVVWAVAHLQGQFHNEAFHCCLGEPDIAEQTSNSKSVSLAEFPKACLNTADSTAIGYVLARNDSRSHFVCLLFGCQIHCSLYWASHCRRSLLAQKLGFACRLAPT